MEERSIDRKDVKYTHEQKTRWVKEVDHLRGQGRTTAEACKEVGCPNTSVYYIHRNRLYHGGTYDKKRFERSKLRRAVSNLPKEPTGPKPGSGFRQRVAPPIPNSKTSITDVQKSPKVPHYNLFSVGDKMALLFLGESDEIKEVLDKVL